MVFILSALWWRRIRGLWKLPDGRDWLRGKLSLVLMVRPMLSKSLIQFSVDEQGCVFSLLFDQKPNYGGGNEGNDDLLQKVPRTHCCTQSPQPWSRPLQTQASARDSWKHKGKSGSVSCGVSVPFSWVPVHKRFCLCHLRVCFPILCKFWHLYGGVNSGLFQEGLCHSQVYGTQSPCSYSNTLLTQTSTGDAQTQFCLSLCGSLGPGVHKVCLSTLGISGGYPL